MILSLCEICRHMKEVISGKGSRFLMCQRAAIDNRFEKYPRQPLVQCAGFEQKEEDPM